MRLNSPVAEWNPTSLSSLRRCAGVSGALLSSRADFGALGEMHYQGGRSECDGQVLPPQDTQEIAIISTSFSPRPVAWRVRRTALPSLTCPKSPALLSVPCFGLLQFEGNAQACRSQIWPIQVRSTCDKEFPLATASLVDVGKREVTQGCKVHPGDTAWLGRRWTTWTLPARSC